MEEADSNVENIDFLGNTLGNGKCINGKKGFLKGITRIIRAEQLCMHGRCTYMVKDIWQRFS